jgi:hypothetical protein
MLMLDVHGTRHTWDVGDLRCVLLPYLQRRPAANFSRYTTSIYTSICFHLLCSLTCLGLCACLFGILVRRLRLLRAIVTTYMHAVRQQYLG